MPTPFHDYVIECSFDEIIDPDFEVPGLDSDHYAYKIETLDDERPGLDMSSGRAYFLRCMGNNVLSAINTGYLSQEEGGPLLYDIVRGEVTMMSKEAFEKLSLNLSSLTKARRTTLANVAVQGNIGMRDLMHQADGNYKMSEYGELFEFLDHGIDEIRWLTKDGLLGQPTVQGIEPKTKPIEAPSKFPENDDSNLLIIAAHVGASVSANQMEVIQPKDEDDLIVMEGVVLRSQTWHSSLGNIDETGKFIPIVTVLSERHPARVDK